MNDKQRKALEMALADAIPNSDVHKAITEALADHEPEPISIWYMRDNHTFRKLPLNVEGALETMREERDRGAVYGMLCGWPGASVPGQVHARSAADWPVFEAAARLWLENVVALK